MKKLPQVFLVLTALGLGIMYGHYNYSRDRGLIPGDRSFTMHLARTARKFTERLSAGSKETEQAPGQGGSDFEVGPTNGPPPSNVEFTDESEGVSEVSEEKLAEPPVWQPEGEKQPSYNEKLDEVDILIKEAAIYLRVATLNKDIEDNKDLEKEYARKALDVTGKALDLIEPLFRKYPDNREIKERLQTIYKQRHDAVKRDHAK